VRGGDTGSPPGAAAGWTASGSALHGSLPGTLTPAALAAFGAAATGTTGVTRSFSGGSSHSGSIGGVPTGGTGSEAGTGIRRSLVDLAPASMFERAGLLRRARAGLPATQDSGRPPMMPPTAATTGAFGRPVPGTIRRAQTNDNPTLGGGPMSLDAGEAHREQAVVDALTPREWDDLVDLVVDRLEDRVRDELARRGRRFSPGVF
jgi:hypothetical protein